MTVVLVLGPQACERYVAALLGNAAEQTGHLVLFGFRKRPDNSHSLSKLALLEILSIIPWFESLYQLVDLVCLAIEIDGAVVPLLGRTSTHHPNDSMVQVPDHSMVCQLPDHAVAPVNRRSHPRSPVVPSGFCGRLRLGVIPDLRVLSCLG